MSLALQEYMVREGKTLAIAESCTGGFLAHLITRRSGASKYFLGSFITYCNELKQSILAVKEHSLQEFGAVSEPIVLEMLEGVFAITKADFGIAVSGIAGPEGGTEEKPVGTVWVAIGGRGRSPKTFHLRLHGNRDNIIHEAAHLSLSFLYEKIQGQGCI
ncbi:MAG: CinA family protein [Chlamydiota bacterium]